MYVSCKKYQEIVTLPSCKYDIAHDFFLLDCFHFGLDTHGGNQVQTSAEDHVECFGRCFDLAECQSFTFLTTDGRCF